MTILLIHYHSNIHHRDDNCQPEKNNGSNQGTTKCHIISNRGITKCRLRYIWIISKLSCSHTLRIHNRHGDGHQHGRYDANSYKIGGKQNIIKKKAALTVATAINQETKTMAGCHTIFTRKLRRKHSNVVHQSSSCSTNYSLRRPREPAEMIIRSFVAVIFLISLILISLRH